MKINLIAAIGKNRELGKNNKLLWKIPEDLKRFREITTGHTVIMGRKTFESIGKPLPNRKNIIVTQNSKLKIQNCLTANSLEQAIDLARKSRHSDEIFIIGGGQIYNQAISMADKLYLTIINKTAAADTFFPDYSAFKKIVFEKEGEWQDLKYKFLELER